MKDNHGRLGTSGSLHGRARSQGRGPSRRNESRPWIDESQQEEMKAAVSATQEKIENNQEKMEAVFRCSKEEIKATINSNQAKLEETIKHQMVDVLASVDRQTQGPHEEIADTKKKLHAEFEHKTLDNQIDIHITNTLLRTTRHGLEAKTTESQTILSRDLTSHGTVQNTGDRNQGPSYAGSWPQYRDQSW
jgi:hypothetical protein